MQKIYSKMLISQVKFCTKSSKLNGDIFVNSFNRISLSSYTFYKKNNDNNNIEHLNFTEV